MFEDIRDVDERVRAVCKYGCTVVVQDDIPARRYYRSGLEMVRMANMYYSDGNLESAFILFSKYITLMVEKLPKHPEYKTTTGPEKNTNNRKLKEVFPRAEELKSKLRAKYAEEEKARAKEEAEEAARLAYEQQLAQEAEMKRLEEEEKRRQEELEREREKEQAEREEQHQQFLQLQVEELNRLEQLHINKQKEQEKARRKPEREAARPSQPTGALPFHDGHPVGALPPHTTPLPPRAQSQPTAPYATGTTLPYESTSPAIYPPTVAATTHPPVPHSTSVPAAMVPDRSLKPAPPSAAPTQVNGSVVPSIDRSNKPTTTIDHFTSIGGTSSTNNKGLRDVIVPANLMDKFLALAFANTSRNVETCGILCGKLSRNAFVITHLLVPHQTGTSDSCTTEDEEQLFVYQDKYDLITLGWIHTHPSQTAFLSSVDLHTHCAYQLMLPEAIAIVCSAKYNETGFFSLTTDHGLDVISSCKQVGFHPHQKEPPLFEDCSHVNVRNDVSVKVVDLRH